MKVTVQKYVDRKAKPLQIEDVGKFEFNDAELKAYPEGLAMYTVISNHMMRLGFGMMQFWTSGDAPDHVLAMIDDRTWWSE